MSRALYVGPMDTRGVNGMTQHQETLLKVMARRFAKLDVLSLFAAPAKAQAWLDGCGIAAAALRSPFAQIARANALAWQAAGTLFAVKMKLRDHFPFFFMTPMPARMALRYDRIFCYYPWGVILLGLDRFADRVAVNLGDVMADRYRRIGVRRWISLSATDEARVVRAPLRRAAISQFDADEFRRLYGAELPVIPSVPPQYADLIALAAKPRPRAAGFFASSGNAINLETLKSLAHPEFLAALAAAKIEFLLGGAITRDLPADLRTALTGGNVRIKGEVKSLGDFYGAIGAMVAPVGPSSGLKMKSVETLLAGRSLITTQWGSDGVFAPFARQIFVLDWPPEPRAMAAAVVAALEDGLADRSLAARNYVEGALLAFELSLDG